MQDINLLKSQITDTTAVWQKRNKILTTVFALLLILELGLAAIFFAQTRATQAKKTAILEQNLKLQAKINEKQESLAPAKDFQAQLQNLSTLLGSHMYWTNFFDELSKHTFIKSKFKNISAESNGVIHLEGEVSNYTDLGKLLLGLSTSTKFSDVKLLSSNPSVGATVAIVFSIDLKVNNELFFED